MAVLLDQSRAAPVEAPVHDGAFPRLDDAQRKRFRALGRLRSVEAGEVGEGSMAVRLIHQRMAALR
jgi:hypothetical protein